MVTRSRQLWVPKLRRRRARRENHRHLRDVDCENRDADEVQEISQIGHPLALRSVLYPQEKCNHGEFAKAIEVDAEDLPDPVVFQRFH